LRAGYNFTKNLGLEGFFSYTQTEIQDESYWNLGKTYIVTALKACTIYAGGRFVPFIAIGLGGIYYSKGYNYIDSSYGERF